MKFDEAAIHRNLKAMQENHIRDNLAYWGRTLRNALIARRRHRPGSPQAMHARQWVRHCIVQLRAYGEMP